MLFDGRAGPAGGGQGDRAAVEGDGVRAARGEDQEAQTNLLQGQLQEETALGSWSRGGTKKPQVLIQIMSRQLIYEYNRELPLTNAIPKALENIHLKTLPFLDLFL